jgi:hypothetical protein
VGVLRERRFAGSSISGTAYPNPRTKDLGQPILGQPEGNNRWDCDPPYRRSHTATAIAASTKSTAM